MTPLSLFAMRLVLVVAGAFIVFTGIDIAFGGIVSLGWQGAHSFLEVTNIHTFQVQDSHIRFLGGVWMGIGFFLALAATNPARYEIALKLAFALIFLGGLARMTQMNFGIVFGPHIVGSFVAEVIGMPILYFWLSRAMTKRGAS